MPNLPSAAYIRGRVLLMSKDSEIVIRGVGAPSKLTDEVLEKAWEYVNRTSDFAYPMLPTIEGLALATQVSRDTLYRWEKDNISTQLSDIMRQLRSAQAEKLIQMSLVGRYNPTISKVLLTKHGYIERTEQDQNVRVVTPILGGLTKSNTTQDVKELDSEIEVS